MKAKPPACRKLFLLGVCPGDQQVLSLNPESNPATFLCVSKPCDSQETSPVDSHPGGKLFQSQAWLTWEESFSRVIVVGSGESCGSAGGAAVLVSSKHEQRMNLLSYLNKAFSPAKWCSSVLEMLCSWATGRDQSPEFAAPGSS